jgi:hypothetical protein
LTGALTQSAGSLLGFGAQNFGATVDFANLERSVRASLLSVTETLFDTDFQNAQLAAIAEQTAVIDGGQERLIEEVKALRREIALMRAQQAA